MPAQAMSLSLGFLCHAEKKKFGLNLSEGNDSIVEGKNVFFNFRDTTPFGVPLF